MDQSGILFYNDPMKYYNAMLNDIMAAKKYVFIETYKFGHQTIGVKFRDALTHVAKKGVEVKLLIDSWGGSSIPDNFFDGLKAAGGKVRLFQKIKINETIAHCEPFDYEAWKRRPAIQKFFEWLVLPIRHLL